MLAVSTSELLTVPSDCSVGIRPDTVATWLHYKHVTPESEELADDT